ncbi:MAG: threonine ammonia-lyase [Bdellovibrionaceae bacterium]|nr:threonine ammonia-lyase [Pseudobdellovibrionaceae bacterium]
MSNLSVTLEDVKNAQDFLKGSIDRTPLRMSRSFSSDVYLKCENLQKTGSFKIRGALNRIRFLTEEEKQKGVIAASAGNHAQGVALGAKIYGVKATIVMPETAPLVKVQATKNYGAHVILHGDYYDHAYQKARELANKEGLIFIHPYQDAKIIAGQGTIGLEIFEDLPQVDQIVVPIGGGGVIGGISFIAKTLNPKCEVIGVVSDQTPGLMNMKEGTKVTPASTVNTIADGIAVKTPSPEMFENYINKYVDHIVSVSDNEIAEAIVTLMEKDKVVTEGSGAAATAAMLTGKIKPKGKTVIFLSGGNIDMNTLNVVVETGLRRKGRLTRISVIVNDLPGSLARLTAIMAQNKANVLDVHHDRVSSELSVRETRIDFLLETASFDHARELIQNLKNSGIRILQGEL